MVSNAAAAIQPRLRGNSLSGGPDVVLNTRKPHAPSVVLTAELSAESGLRMELSAAAAQATTAAAKYGIRTERQERTGQARLSAQTART